MKTYKYGCGKQSGFSIVELMVSIIVGLLVILAATGSASFFEANRRSTIGGNNAQENAMAVAFHIQKDARMAGLGIIPECTKFNVYYDSRKTGATAAPYASNGGIIAPVSITAGTTITSDSISFLSMNSLTSSATILLAGGNPISSSVLDTMAPIASGQVKVNDIGLLIPPVGDTLGVPCTVVGVTGLPDTTKIQYNPGNSAPGHWNAPSNGGFTYPTADGTNKISPNSRFINIGSFNWVQYQPSNTIFQILDKNTNITSDIAENIVMFKAQYGVSAEFITPATPPTLPVAQWINPGTFTDSANTSKNAAIRAIRIVIVARGAQKEKPASGNAADTCDATTSAPATGLSTRTNIDDELTLDLSADANWRCYKYRTVTLTIPLKNLLIQTINTIPVAGS